MSKRSTSVALFLVGATAFALAGCREETVDAQAFPDLQSCLDATGSGSLFSADDCRKGFEEAQALNAETAPRYDSLEVCEAQYGEGNCGSEQQVTGGSGMGSIFMPLLAGYLMGNMLGGGRGLGAQPLHRTADGRFATPAGTTYANNTGKGKVGAGAFTKAPTTVGKPPLTKATAAQRGGFGSSATRSTSGVRSMGG
ncbi:uncharacterized protein YgiB involved in biofilm formation [Rhodobacter aestuarii]|uniref:Uncharacterized conserved protein YgiB, involved in bioifilm formation, UPF0441/DUF1190 family n=1 Tax=Rhodobacter aestuarii TaxID=453582 RepID=A0A1N7IW92_9RHOB|nr:DUF1190 domain-containing protein [Rhodobacter aestuarii]PTV97473.1 uncharacterized protein YgiB involved in biofilm formation [Rhodobacter aestuarii]SIS41266.1 Uncharacterized conserved protein YgiB, involved in bioifilm formation, UPF0441/DUF1190 family [Rhodobacter aestuarii]